MLVRVAVITYVTIQALLGCVMLVRVAMITYVTIQAYARMCDVG